MSATKRDYALLGLPADCAMSEVKAAHRALVRRWHPDNHPEGSGAAHRLALINAAYDRICADRAAASAPKWTPQHDFTAHRDAAARAARAGAGARTTGPAKAEAAAADATARAGAGQAAAPGRGAEGFRASQGSAQTSAQPQSRGLAEVRLGPAQRRAMIEFLTRKQAQELFYGLQARQDGIYAEIRPPRSRREVPLPGFAAATKVRFRGRVVEIHLEGACAPGRNIVALPELSMRDAGTVQVGRGIQCYEFSCGPRAGRIVRLNPKAQPVAGARDIQVELHFSETPRPPQWGAGAAPAGTGAGPAGRTSMAA